MLGDRRHVWIAAAIAVLTFALLVPYLDDSLPSLRGAVSRMPDEGTILSNADRVARGQPLYREAFDFKGPIGYLPFIIGYKFAPPTVRVGRVVQFAIMAWWAAVMYCLAYRLTRRSTMAVVVALLVPLQIWPAWTFAYQDFTAQLLLAVAALAALQGFDGARHGLPVAGGATALALWTNISQGTMGMLALGGAIVLVAGIGDGWRAAARALSRFALGVAVATGAVFSWLATMGSLKAGLDAQLVFPFKHYMSAFNTVHYAYDEDTYPLQWLGSSRLAFITSKIMFGAIHYVPFLALIVSGSVALGLLVLAVRRVRLSAGPVQGVALLASMGIPAALAAPAIPVVMEKTRADVCHIGFIVGGCVVAFCALFAVRSTHRIWGRVLAVVRGCAGVGLVGVFAAASLFYIHSIYVKAPGFQDIDTRGRVDYLADQLVARTRPEDRILVTPWGGFYYLYSRRDNATSFGLLFDEPYCITQWPIAARQVRERRPLLLAIQERHFQILQEHEPILTKMYFGYSGNYLLADRGVGPPFVTPARWSLTRYTSNGAIQSSVDVSLRDGGQSARMLASTPERPYELLAALHRDVFSLFDGSESYFGKVSTDGTHMEGTIFGPGTDRRRFSAIRIMTR